MTNHWYIDVDWQLVGALVVVWVGVGVLYIISRLKPRKRAPVKLKGHYWKR